MAAGGRAMETSERTLVSLMAEHLEVTNDLIALCLKLEQVLRGRVATFAQPSFDIPVGLQRLQCSTQKLMQLVSIILQQKQMGD